MDTSDTGANPAQDGILFITRDVVTAFLGTNPIPAAQVPDLIASVYASVADAVSGAVKQVTTEPAKPTPAEIARSITPDALISFIDGRSYKTLRRHLTAHGLDLAGYRQRYGLPSDYPSTAANYSAQRSELARSIGLGRPKASVAAAPVDRAA